jgi:hypothetical protein
MPVKYCLFLSFFSSLLQALLEYEKHKIETGEFQVASSALPDRIGSESQVQFYVA